MQARPTAIADVVVLEPKVFGDERGFFYESFNRRALEAALGRPLEFVQDNHSLSRRGVLRGLHYQRPGAQGKLVRVTRGEVFDVAVDLRRGSATCGRHVGLSLSAENRRQLWIPEGFAHGFLVVSEVAEFQYKVTDYYAPDREHCLRFDDPSLAIDWPLGGLVPTVSAKDLAGRPFDEAALFDMEP
jgi:dTDP-4-dehydrorhamnose 3,5-epimerase